MSEPMAKAAEALQARNAARLDRIATLGCANSLTEPQLGALLSASSLKFEIAIRKLRKVDKRIEIVAARKGRVSR